MKRARETGEFSPKTKIGSKIFRWPFSRYLCHLWFFFFFFLLQIFRFVSFVVCTANNGKNLVEPSTLNAGLVEELKIIIIFGLCMRTTSSMLGT